MSCVPKRARVCVWNCALRRPDQSHLHTTHVTYVLVWSTVLSLIQVSSQKFVKKAKRNPGGA